MSQDCIQPEDIGRVLQLPESDARVAHARECPKCRSLLLSYQAFLQVAEDEAPAGANVRDAERRLSEIVNREMAGESSRLPIPARENPFARWWRSLAANPVWAATGVVAVLLAGSLFLMRTGTETGESVLRGGPDTSTAGEFELLGAERRDAATWTLRWQNRPDADQYRVRLHSIDLSNVVVLGPVTEAELIVSSRELSALREGEEDVLWRVEALRQGDVIATSDLGRISLR